MDEVGTMTEMIKRLPEDHKQRLIEFIWLFSQAEEPQKNWAIEQLKPLLAGELNEEAAFMLRLENLVKELQQAMAANAGA
jgi:hypothetical protein